MINNFDQETNMAILEVSMKLADIFEDHIEYEGEWADDGSVYISEEGMEMLGDTFAEIDLGLREAVFNSLLDELTERDIPFDIEQFKDVDDG